MQIRLLAITCHSCFCLTNFALTLPTARNSLPSNIYMKLPLILFMSLLKCPVMRENFSDSIYVCVYIYIYIYIYIHIHKYILSSSLYLYLQISLTLIQQQRIYSSLSSCLLELSQTLIIYNIFVYLYIHSVVIRSFIIIC